MNISDNARRAAAYIEQHGIPAYATDDGNVYALNLYTYHTSAGTVATGQCWEKLCHATIACARDWLGY